VAVREGGLSGRPLPTLFKERLFVYLSRFCEVRYCITRHCGFLLGLGRAAGDPDAQAMTITQVIRLLQRPVPDDECVSAALARFEAVAEPIDWPSAETANDDDLFYFGHHPLSPAGEGQGSEASPAHRAWR
jgi:hypothetical protein